MCSPEDVGAPTVDFDSCRPDPGTGYWDNDPQFPVEDWMAEVSNGDTRQGYWPWVRAKREEAADDAKREQEGNEHA